MPPPTISTLIVERRQDGLQALRGLCDAVLARNEPVITDAAGAILDGWRHRMIQTSIGRSRLEVSLTPDAERVLREATTIVAGPLPTDRVVAALLDLHHAHEG